MSPDSSASPNSDQHLSGLVRALFGSGGSKSGSGPWVPPTVQASDASVEVAGRKPRFARASDRAQGLKFFHLRCNLIRYFH